MKYAIDKIKLMVYTILEKILPEMWFRSLWALYIKINPNYDDSAYNREYFLSKKRGGERYCIFRHPQIQFGIGAVMKYTLVQCEWAAHKHMIPVIDYEWNYCFGEKIIGQDNGWEYIFKPNAFLEEIINNSNDNYVFVGGIGEVYIDNKTKNELELKVKRVIVKENDREYYRKLNEYSKKWWRLQDDVVARYRACFEKLFRPGMKILGVALREEFSIDAKKEKMELLSRHPHHLSLDEMIRVIKEYKDCWKCTHVFVTTYFEDSIIKLKEEFGEALLYTDRRRVFFEQFHEIRKLVEDKYYGTNQRREFVEWVKSEDEQAQIYNTFDKNTMIEYVEEIYGLSLCDCLVAGKSGSTLCACVWNGGKYQELKILSDDNESILY